MMKRFSILIVAVMVVTAVFGQSADQWLKQGNDYYEKQQFSKAVECYQQAAEAGSQEGQFNLGYALYNGEGIDKDYATAAMWFKRAARKGFAKAQYNLAYCYMYGRGVPIDYDKALRNLTDAANNGNKNAQLTLAECYEKGVLVMQDKKMSQLWKDKAAGKHTAAIPLQEVEEVKPAVATTTPPPAPKPTPTPVEKPVEQPVVAQQPPAPAPRLSSMRRKRSDRRSSPSSRPQANGRQV